MITLDKRLSAVAALVRPGSRLADIGTDHAFLPCHLLRAGICQHMIAADVSENALSRAKANLTRQKLIDRAIVGNLTQVTVIHGKGTGAVRAACHSYLKRCKGVKSFRLGNFGEGVYQCANWLTDTGHNVVTKLYSGYRHEIHNYDDIKFEVEETIIEWLFLQL